MGAEKNSITDNRPFFQSISDGATDLSLLNKCDRFPSAPYIYGIYNIAKNKLYIGQSSDLWARMCNHRYLLKSNDHHCKEMSKDYITDSSDFVFFAIEHVDKTRFNGIDSFKSELKIKEGEYIKKTPKHTQYNSSSMFKTEIVKCHKQIGPDNKELNIADAKVSIRRIGELIGLSSDSIRLARIQMGIDSDLIPIDSAIQFVKARTTAAGRRTEQQAQAARMLLVELEKSAVPAPEHIEEQPRTQESQPGKEEEVSWVIFIPLVLSTIASLANMGLIFHHLTGGHTASTIVLTGVFSGSALCFIYAGLRGDFSRFVIWLLIGFEAFCNLTGVYYGLLGRTGTPTRFLGMVTDIMSSGTHWTAIGLGATMAIIISLVQLVSINSIIKK